MEVEPGKLFVGGISWDTSEESFREYFETFGEVLEAVIMKDRATGRARGFGFVVFANASVAEKVVRERHVIGGVAVEAKKAVPRDDHRNFNRNNGGSIQGSPGPTRTKKIFVGGLASTVTENDFKNYFDQFGTISDVVVMYDHNTQRPRGFGFITYDSEEAVDRVLLKTFHELNGKMVEVKRAVPKESSPGPTRSQSSGYSNYGGLNRVSSLLNDYSPRYKLSSPIGYGIRMDGRFSPVTVGRFSPSSYNSGLSLDSEINMNYGISGDSGLDYGREMSTFYNGNTNRYGMGGISGNGGTLLNTMNSNLWDDGKLNYGTKSVTSNAFLGSATGNGGGLTGNLWDDGKLNYGTKSVSSNAFIGPATGIGGGLTGNFRTIGEIWGSSHIPNQSPGSGFSSIENDTYGSRSIGSASVMSNLREGTFGDLYGNELFYGNHAWRSSSPELEGANPFGYGRGSALEVVPNNSVGYIGDYSVTSRSNRGIAA